MTSDSDFRQRITEGRDKNLVVYIDSVSLIRMAALIDPFDVSKRALDQNPTLLKFIEHLGQLGATVIIPESVAFESTGHRASGTQLTQQFEDDIEYPYLRRFLQDVYDGKIKNVRIEPTPATSHALEKLSELKDNKGTFNRYRREHFIGQGDRDIVALYGDNTNLGRTFVVTEDRGLTKILDETANAEGRPIGVLDAVSFCAQIQQVAPIEWLDPSVSTEGVRGYINKFFKHDNQRRISKNRSKGSNWYYDDDYKGFTQNPEGEPDFNQALHDMMQSQQKGR